MHYNLKQNLLVVTFLLIGISSFISFDNTIVSASLTDSTDLSVLKAAPSGISVDKYMSNSAPSVSEKGDIYTTNSAQILDTSGNNSINGNIIALASGKNTYGSIWSNDKTFDINKEQTISAWLYFGSGDGSQDVNSEGIAFVLQNDDKGIAALGAGLEGLGVYGYDASQFTIVSGTAASQSYIQKTAIQNSIALEFDSDNNSFYTPTAPINNDGLTVPPSISQIVNGAYFSLDGYDTQLGTSATSLTSSGFSDKVKYGAGGAYGHIALTYPSFANSYKKIDSLSSAYSPWTEGYVLAHDGAQQAQLTDGTDEYGNPFQWHHVTIKWIPASSGSTKATLEYSYNDKNIDYSDNTSTKSDIKELTSSIPVDTSKLNSSDGKVRWGFTAANGASSNVASKLVALDSAPDLLYADADSDIVDTTLGNKKITESSTDNTVADGDSLKLNYELNYISGNEDWKDIAAKIKIPDDTTVTPDSDGNVATITYSDGTTENISSSELSNSTIQHTLAKTIGTTASAAGKTATITINATAKNKTSSNINVAKSVATFIGSNEISTTNSPAFTILANPSYSLKLSNTNSSNELNLLYKLDNATLNLPTELTYSDNHSFEDSTNILYQITAGGKEFTVGASASGTSYDQTIDLKSLMDDDTFWNIFTEDSTQTVTIKAIDQANGLVSNTLTYKVITKPNKTLSMTVSNNLAFQNINAGDTTKYLHRKTNFKLSVTSLREPWLLSVSTKGLYLNGRTLNKNLALVYRKDSNSTYSTLSSTPTLIDQNTTSYETSNTDNISDDWNKNTGLLLKQLGANTAGQYTGTLSWSVTDALNNN